ncbi:MAG: periplasmic heavy metal sensor [Candidatus Rokubacteria bacterium]|nr:periplasmic heavy metal sensor [Candidatus Rokubacteria bacterium]
MLRIVLVVALVLSLGVLTAAAQHHGHAQSGSAAHAPGGHAAHRQMQATLDEIDRVIASGRGAGMAFAADRHGYPGPLHVLELKDQLRLTPAQEARIIALQEAMFADSRPKSARLMEAEARLRRLFAEGVADEAGVRAAVAESERARTEVRLVHLLTHLQTRRVLTAEQRRLYHEARWAQ